MTETALLEAMKDAAREAGAEAGIVAIRAAMPEILELIDRRFTELAPPDKLCSVREIAKDVPLSMDAIYKRLQRASLNGLEASGAVVRSGRRTFLWRDRFFRWLGAEY